MENPQTQLTPYPPTQGTPYPPTQGTPYPPAQGTPYPPTQGTPYPPAQGTPYPPTQETPYPNQQSQQPPPYPTLHPSNPPPGAPFSYPIVPVGYAPPTNPLQGQFYPPPAAPPPAYNAQPPVYVTEDPEAGLKEDDGMFSFNEKSVRLAFIRKVYGILALQMVVTVALSCLFMFHQPTRFFVQRHLGFYIASYGLFLCLYFVLVCCTKVARSYPTNMILLSVFTLSLSYMVAAITSYHDTKIVLMAFSITLIICVSVSLFACQTKYDFTTCGGLLFVCTLCLLLFGIFAGVLIPTGHMRAAQMAYAGAGALLFAAFLAFDTQLIMGGNRYEIDPEDYVFAAMMLYVDVIYIFLFLLALFGGGD